MTEPTRLFLGLKKFLSEHVFKGDVKVTNLPDVQRVEITNPSAPTETVAVSNLGELGKELTDKLQQVSSDLSKTLKTLESKPENYDTIIKALDKVAVSVDEKEIPLTDIAPAIDILKDIVGAVKDSKVNVDLGSVERILGEILAAVPSLEDLIEKGRIKVVLSDEQLKKIGGSFAVATGGGMRALSSTTDSVNTELPAAAALADATANPTAPAVAAHHMGWNGTNWDRGLSYNLTNGASSGGTYLVPGVVPLKRAAGAPVENFTTSDPGVIRTVQHGTFTDAFTDGGVGWDPMLAPGACYNALGNTWYFNRSAQQTYSMLGLDRLGVPVSAMTAQYDDTGTDLPAENTFHHPRITNWRALHSNLRDASGNEIQESTEATLLASASRTTTQTGADITNYSGFKYLTVVLDMTNVAAGPSVTLTIQGKDVASGAYYTILAGAAVTTVSTNVYRVGPGHVPAANVTSDYTLPRTWRILVTANNANAGTYSVGYSLTK